MDALGICNAALVAVGVDRITILDVSESHVAEVCVTQYPLVRDLVLGDLEWRFAGGRYQVAEDAVAPVFGFAHRYPLASTIIAVRAVSDGYAELDDWEVEGRFVLTDHVSPVYLRTTDRIIDAMVYPPGFCSALAARLAAYFALEFRESRTLHEAMMQLYEVELKRGSQSDMQQSRQQSYVGGSIQTVRDWRR